MRQYELTVVLSPQSKTDKLDQVIKQIEDLITKVSGKITESEDWGEKHLSYKIKSHDSGLFRHFVLDLNPQAIAELEGKLKLIKGVLRLLLVKKEK